MSKNKIRRYPKERLITTIVNDEIRVDHAYTKPAPVVTKGQLIAVALVAACSLAYIFTPFSDTLTAALSAVLAVLAILAIMSIVNQPKEEVVRITSFPKELITDKDLDNLRTNLNDSTRIESTRDVLEALEKVGNVPAPAGDKRTAAQAIMNSYHNEVVTQAETEIQDELKGIVSKFVPEFDSHEPVAVENKSAVAETREDSEPFTEFDITRGDEGLPILKK